MTRNNTHLKPGQSPTDCRPGKYFLLKAMAGRCGFYKRMMPTSYRLKFCSATTWLWREIFGL